MKEIKHLELQRDKIMESMGFIRLCSPKKYIIHSDGTLEDITKYPDMTDANEALDYIQKQIFSFYHKQTQTKAG